MRNDITAAMIVKNEEANLERCLESLRDLMPIVIVDTGSTDRTMEIARDFGAMVYEHPWNDSFSEARNHALGYVKTEFALQIDADEQVAEATISALDELDPKVTAYQIPIHNMMPNGSITLHHFERIHKPAHVHYKWRVHNELVVEEGDVGRTQFSIRHFGYALSEEEMQKKYENTHRLLLMDIEDAGYVPRNVRYMIQTLRNTGRHKDILAVIDDHISKLEGLPGVYQDAAASAIVAHNALGDNTKAKVAGIKLLGKFPEALDALFYMGVVNMEDQAWGIAREFFVRFVKVRTALQLEGCDSTVSYHTWGHKADAFQSIGICSTMLGQTARAALFHLLAEMRAKHRSDIAGFTANTDNAMCQLLDGEPKESKQRKLVKLTLPDEDTPKPKPMIVALPSLKGSGEVITKD